MKALFYSKKMVISLIGILAIVVLVVLGKDLETVKWVGRIHCRHRCQPEPRPGPC